MIIISLIEKRSSNNFHIHISVVGISWISLFGDFILSLMNVYSMWCAISSVFRIEQTMFL